MSAVTTPYGPSKTHFLKYYRRSNPPPFFFSRTTPSLPRASRLPPFARIVIATLPSRRSRENVQLTRASVEF